MFSSVVITFLNILQSAIEKLSEIKSDEGNLANHEMQSQFQRDIAVQQAVISKTYHIMALQGKLLALTEDLELFRKENNDLRDKNEKLNKQVTNNLVSFIFNNENISKGSHNRCC